MAVETRAESATRFGAGFGRLLSEDRLDHLALEAPGGERDGASSQRMALPAFSITPSGEIWLRLAWSGTTAPASSTIRFDAAVESAVRDPDDLGG